MRRLVPRYSKLLRLSTVLSLPVTLTLLIGAAVAGSPGWFLAAAVATYLAEPTVFRLFAEADRPLRWGDLGAGARLLIRQGAFVLLFAQAGGVGDATVATAAIGLFALDWLRAGTLIGATALRRGNSLPYATRNLGAGEPAYPKAEPRWHVRLIALVERYADALPVLAGAVGLLVDVPALLVAGLVLAAATMLGSVGWQTPRLKQMRRLANGKRVGRDVQRRVSEYGPEVVLYFTGTAVNAYQGNMWLETLERLNRKAMVLVRSPEVVAALAPTRLPIVCISRAEDMMNFDWTTVRVALYTGNTGKNLHLLREPDIKHVFVGHGDSDKDSSSNPVSKVFDEVWVAGPAGRDRYRNSEAGVRDEAIVEVGRPQLAGITQGPTGNEVPTVLYAPTWEGWDSDHSYCSLLPMGEKIIGALLAQGPGLRVIYRPHPYTGTRMASAAAAHRRIVAMIEQANQAGGAHRVVTGAEASLHDCFNRSDMLITDISSVISDYMPSLKPYVVTNPHGVDDARFRADFPSASAAYLLGPGCAELTDILAVATTPGRDPLADDRAELRDYLLGPAEPDAMTRFATAVDTLAEAGPRSTKYALPTPRVPDPA
ncbi:CDP-glycerol:poly(glycerophosphate) glycerophosphotransferase [Actinomadura pelletieri DSM 43383]|uniref:CDP-glycerol:poly(Glycerophosphate) glycerophosphotransferase n=1 Tax=Actinomadura pelletieri DSM 43383 TaxID=1120940 RepID=A0A495QAQ6_9ACTN|nr:CDP-glycerol glycerophosphotransferase family protein [Actinomadura pelletieri]RKS68396.1 CDP-glycerol:poly(glycerophosphate) glycerophosphotransferase [Actinomadura pelletieri DSM 43383]